MIFIKRGLKLKNKIKRPIKNQMSQLLLFIEMFLINIQH